MAIFERVLGGNIFYDFWKQFQQYIFSERRLIQLVTLQPIQIYETTTDLEVDNAKVRLYIKSNVENLVQRRIDRAVRFLTLSSVSAKKDSFVYDFDIVIKAQMLYEDVSRFFNHHFSNQSYPIEENKYYLTIENFRFENAGTKALVHLPFILDAKWGPFRRKMKGTAVFTGSVNFNQPKYVIKTRNLNYKLETDSIILKMIDTFYHAQLITFLNGFLQYNFMEELFNAKVEAQLQINSFQNQSNWLNGSIHDLDLESMTIDPEAVHAVFIAKGKLHIIR